MDKGKSYGLMDEFDCADFDLDVAIGELWCKGGNK